jgi:DNA-binding NtrC family response regulator
VSLRVLVAEDEAITLKHLTAALAGEGYEVTGVANGAEALRRVEQGSFDLLIADIKMPGMDGLTLLGEVKGRFPEVDVFIVTGFGSVESAVEAMRRGALDYLTKPYNLDELLLKVRRVAEKKRLESENTALKVTLGLGSDRPLIARSRAMRRIAELIEEIRGSSCNVLITGESGVGKGLVARLIHETGPRSGGPFLALNCAVFTEELLASELFGHEKGAFTGAVSTKRGLLEIADAGTLFLDEIAEMPPGLQAKLLKVIEEKEFMRVGGTRTIRVDVRTIAATNQNLGALRAEGRFREDLYYRLNVMEILIPPLRDRREDIRPLAEHFLEKHVRRAGGKIRGFSPEALRQLLAYGFPGNVRELENIVERAVILERSDLVRPESLPQSIALFQVETFSPNRIRTLEELDREYAEKVLEHVEQNKSKAAELLGISRTTLWRLLSK